MSQKRSSFKAGRGWKDLTTVTAKLSREKKRRRKANKRERENSGRGEEEEEEEGAEHRRQS